MGDTLRYARRMRLIAMQPRGDLSSTSYALANPGEEYLVLQPAELADPFTVTMDPAPTPSTGITSPAARRPRLVR
jgi:hypothetical protein